MQAVYRVHTRRPLLEHHVREMMTTPSVRAPQPALFGASFTLARAARFLKSSQRQGGPVGRS